MTDTILASIIGAFATISAAFIGYIINGIIITPRNTVFSKGDKFTGNWEFSNGKNIIEDSIFVKSVWLGRIKCIGTLMYEGIHKEYFLTGKVYSYCITFNYLGLENGKNDNTAGVVLLDNTRPDKTILYGSWSQLKKTGEIINGSVTWKRN